MSAVQWATDLIWGPVPPTACWVSWLQKKAVSCVFHVQFSVFSLLFTACSDAWKNCWFVMPGEDGQSLNKGHAQRERTAKRFRRGAKSLGGSVSMIWKNGYINVGLESFTRNLQQRADHVQHSRSWFLFPAFYHSLLVLLMLLLSSGLLLTEVKSESTSDLGFLTYQLTKWPFQRGASMAIPRSFKSDKIHMGTPQWDSIW